ERLAAIACSLKRDGDVFLYSLLADVFVQRLWTHAGVEPRVVIHQSTGNNPLRHHSFCCSIRHSNPSLAHHGTRAAFPFCPVNDCNDAFNSFSKFETPASRFPSPTAFSAVRPS